ncbi:PGPGW domain-containing protein [Aeromicrobium sp. CF4.19]|uniref:PGPGW domain-containing protein n=1 Tax=Aeromicrobium sp. CF4.19 TaxID=3373082 RepID=UPI003EE6C3CA
MSLWARLKAWFTRTGSESLGWVLVVVGILLMPLPGPGTLIVVSGVALLSRHYSWARRILDPLKAWAMEAAEAGVQTIPRITLSFLGGLWIFAVGVIWWIGPTIPEFELLGVAFGPDLPAQGWVTALGLIASAIVAWALIVYSMYRWRWNDTASAEATVS